MDELVLDETTPGPAVTGSPAKGVSHGRHCRGDRGAGASRPGFNQEQAAHERLKVLAAPA